MKVQRIEFTGAFEARLAETEIGAPGPGQLAVRTTRTMISTGTEGIVYARNFAPDTHFDRWIKYPFHPGYLHCGVIEAVGEGVDSRWRPGMRVATRSPHCSHALVAAQDAFVVPDGVSDESAAWMGLGRITQIGVRAAQHRLGDAVVVIGLGLLGQLVVQYAALLGARLIVAIDPSETRLARIDPALGVHLFRGTAADALDEVQRLTGGVGADVVYEVTGHHAVFPSALPLARHYGTVVLLGDTGQPHLQTLTPHVVTHGLRVVGAHDHHAPATSSDPGVWTGPRIQELFLHYLARRQIRVDHLTTHRYWPQQVKEAYEMLRRRRDGAMAVYFVWD